MDAHEYIASLFRSYLEDEGIDLTEEAKRIARESEDKFDAVHEFEYYYSDIMDNFRNELADLMYDDISMAVDLSDDINAYIDVEDYLPSEDDDDDDWESENRRRAPARRPAPKKAPVKKVSTNTKAGCAPKKTTTKKAPRKSPNTKAKSKTTAKKPAPKKAPARRR